MQIDVLSTNTLKLTLSRLDMFDLDIKYESISGKNPETKRLLAHVLKSIQLDRRIGFDFSGERLFVEAFPRPDGGCMLYISCLEPENNSVKRNKKVKSPELTSGAEKNIKNEKVKEFPKLLGAVQICEVKGLRALSGLCRCLCWQAECERLSFESALFAKGSTYRLVINGDSPRLIAGIIKEYGELLRSETDKAATEEHFKLIAKENAAELMLKCI